MFVSIIAALCVIDIAAAIARPKISFSDTISSDMCKPTDSGYVSITTPTDECLNGIWMGYSPDPIYLDVLPADASDAEPPFHYYITNALMPKSVLQSYAASNRLLFFIPLDSHDDLVFTGRRIYDSIFDDYTDYDIPRNIQRYNCDIVHDTVLTSDDMCLDPGYYLKNEQYDDNEVIIIEDDASAAHVRRFAHFFDIFTDNFVKLQYKLINILNQVNVNIAGPYESHAFYGLTNTLDLLSAVVTTYSLPYDVSIVPDTVLFTNNGKSMTIRQVFDSAYTPAGAMLVSAYTYFKYVIEGSYGLTMNDMCASMFAYQECSSLPPEPTACAPIPPEPTSCPVCPVCQVCEVCEVCQTLPPTPTSCPTMPPTPTSCPVCEVCQTLPPTPTSCPAMPPTPTSCPVCEVCQTLPPTPTSCPVCEVCQTLPPTPTSCPTMPPTPTSCPVCEVCQVCEVCPTMPPAPTSCPVCEVCPICESSSSHICAPCPTIPPLPTACPLLPPAPTSCPVCPVCPTCDAYDTSSSSEVCTPCSTIPPLPTSCPVCPVCPTCDVYDTDSSSEVCTPCSPCPVIPPAPTSCPDMPPLPTACPICPPCDSSSSPAQLSPCPPPTILYVTSCTCDSLAIPPEPTPCPVCTACVSCPDCVDKYRVPAIIFATTTGLTIVSMCVIGWQLYSTQKYIRSLRAVSNEEESTTGHMAPDIADIPLDPTPDATVDDK